MTRSFRSLGVHSAQRVAVFHGFKFPNFRNPTWNEEKINRINTQGKKVNLLNRFPFETSTKFQEWKQTNIIILKWPAFPSLRSGVVWSKTVRGCHHGLLTAPAPSQPARPPTPFPLGICNPPTWGGTGTAAPLSYGALFPKIYRCPRVNNQTTVEY